MTTVIMISNDTSVIISNGESEDSSSPSKWSGSSSGDSKSKWSPSSGSSGLASSSGSASSPYQSAPASLKRKEELGGRRKSSVSTVESDSEELAQSSCSTTSTLSSRTSGVSSGAASTNLPTTPLPNVNQWLKKETLGERQFTTLSRTLPKPRPSGPVYRAKSFHYMGNGANAMLSGAGTRVLSTFQPSEHSAFQRLGGGLGGPGGVVGGRSGKQGASNLGNPTRLRGGEREAVKGRPGRGGEDQGEWHLA